MCLMHPTLTEKDMKKTAEVLAKVISMATVNNV